MKQAMRKIKVLGYPFAGGQPRGGVELTPGWILKQEWFRNLTTKGKVPVTYEEVNVSSQYCNSYHPDPQSGGTRKGEIIEAKNIKNVIASSLALKSATLKAM